MPRLTDEMIFSRINQAMMPQRKGTSPQAIESLIQKAKMKRAKAQPERIK